jgi:nitrile hydratase beta subunit
MDGIHDMGGMQGFGPVLSELDEPPFHERWEGRVHGIAMTLWAADAGIGSLRPQIERIETTRYLTTSYYEHWLDGLERSLTLHGHITMHELAQARQRHAAGVAVATRIDQDLANRTRAILEPEQPAPPIGEGHRYRIGQRVAVRRISAIRHNRCPRYVRGVTGTVERLLAPAWLPENEDTGGDGEGRGYTVAFAAADLWPDDGADHTVLVDLWEHYLQDGEERR